jgi:O-antigen/teichoic acid export membrane protein
MTLAFRRAAFQMNRARLKTILRSKLTANYFFYSLDYGLRIIVQFGYFAIISRSLGAAGYGIFASISAISILAGVFSGLGSEQVMIRRSAGDPAAFRSAFGHTLICIAGSIAPVSAICFLVLQFMNTGGIAWWSVALFIVSETLFTKLIYLANACFMAHEVAGRQFVINITTSSIKLAGAALAWTFSHPLTLEIWSAWYFASIGLGAAFAMGLVLWELGRPRFTFFSGELRDGLQYGLEFASVVALRDLDKPLVVETLGAEAGGLYTAAFRIVDTACIPVRALLLATYTRYFSHAKTDTRAAVAFGFRVLPLGLAISAVLGLCLLLFAWIVPLIIGPTYEKAVPIIEWFAIYPAIILLSGAGMDLLRSVGLLGPRLRIALVSIVTYLPLCWIGAISAGTIGVTIARSVSQLLLAAMTWFTIVRHDHKDGKAG